jgi:hypothetical protein
MKGIRIFTPKEPEIGDIQKIKITYSAWGYKKEEICKVRVIKVTKTRVFLEKLEGWVRCPKVMPKPRYLKSVVRSECLITINDQLFDISTAILDIVAQSRNASLNRKHIALKELENLRIVINSLSELKHIVSYRKIKDEISYSFQPVSQHEAKRDIVQALIEKQKQRYSVAQIRDPLTLSIPERLSILAHRLDEAKQPKTAEEYIGIEIETMLPNTNMLTRSLLPYINNVEIKQDRSLKRTNNTEPVNAIGREFAILLKRSEIETKLPRIVKAIKAAGGYVNDSCGLHVHLDMRNRNSEIVAKNLVNRLDDIWRMCSPKRLTNKYCLDNRSNALPASARYYAINKQALEKYGTIEIRTKESTLDVNDILNYINNLYQFAEISA